MTDTQIITDIANQIEKTLNGKTRTTIVVSLATLLQRAMELVEDYDGTGRSIVESAIREVLRRSCGEESELYAALNALLLQTLPGLIDLIIAGTKGKLKLNARNICTC